MQVFFLKKAKQAVAAGLPAGLAQIVLVSITRF